MRIWRAFKWSVIMTVGIVLILHIWPWTFQRRTPLSHNYKFSPMPTPGELPPNLLQVNLSKIHDINEVPQKPIPNDPPDYMDEITINVSEVKRSEKEQPRGEHFPKNEANKPSNLNINDNTATYLKSNKTQIQNKTLEHPVDICENSFTSGFHIDSFCLPNDTKNYFKWYKPSFRCLLEGTMILETERSHKQICLCKQGWQGTACSVPDVVDQSADYPQEYGVGYRKVPRRIIYGMPFNHEFELLETKISELDSVVDAFIILESNYTSSGIVKGRRLLEALQNGFLKDVQHKIVYLTLGYFPATAYANGWIIESLLRNHIGKVGLKEIVYNVRDDDIFVMGDADEIPVKEALLYLKVHYGYPEPFGFVLKQTVYGFYWQGVHSVSTIYGGCSIKMLNDVFHFETYDLRSAPKSMGKDNNALRAYNEFSGGRAIPWSFGSKDLPAGWHCSWCFKPEGIQQKLTSAHWGDFPRWGSDERKTALPYIEHLVEKGIWFDEKTQLDKIVFTDYMYAPDFILANKDRFKHLLDTVNYPQKVTQAVNYVENVTEAADLAPIVLKYTTQGFS